MKKIILLMLLILAVAGCSNNSGIDNTVDSTLNNLKTEVTDDIDQKELEIANTDSTTNESDNAPASKETQEIVPPVTKTESTLDNIAEKKRYLESLQSAVSLLIAELDSEEAMYKVLEIWDSELNKIYGLLEEKLSSEEIEILKKDELAWIKFRDTQIENTDAVDFILAEYSMELTRKRTLYLIDMYFDEPTVMKYVQLADSTGHIREHPSIDSKIVSNGKMGDMYIYLQKKVDTADGRTWFKVEYGSGSIGYISSAISNLTNETPSYVRLTEENVKVRSAPSINSDILWSGYKDEVFEYSDERILSSDGRIWLKVNFSTKTAYISQKVSIMTR